MKNLILCSLLAALPLFGQEIKFPASFEKLAAKASETVDVTLDANMLQLARKFLSGEDTDEAKAKKLVSGLKGIYVRSFEFEKEGEYSQADVEEIRSQLRTPQWSRIVGVRSKKDGENAEIYLKHDGKQIVGLSIVAAEPKELTIVNIVGPIDPEQLSDLGGRFGVPKMEIEFPSKQKKSEKAEKPETK